MILLCSIYLEERQIQYTLYDYYYVPDLIVMGSLNPNTECFKITYYDNVLFCQQWIDKGVILVQVILEDGNLKSYDDMLEIIPRDQIAM